MPLVAELICSYSSMSVPLCKYFLSAMELYDLPARGIPAVNNKDVIECKRKPRL
jgi:hypothetical protein